MATLHSERRTRRKALGTAGVTKRYRNRVRECRLKALIAHQDELGRRTGIPRTTISALENNRLFLSSQYALLISEALGCRLDELFERITRNGLGEDAYPGAAVPIMEHDR